jgi:hypothetical protein
MKNSDWIKILEDHKEEDWLYYGIWLQDEQNRPLSNEAILWMISNKIDPIDSCQKGFYFWETLTKRRNSLPEDVYNKLNKSKDVYMNNYAGDYIIYYKSVLEAKLDLINAYERTKLEENS